MQGLASDGGLFMPNEWPQVDLDHLKTLETFLDIANYIVPKFTKSSFTDDEVSELLDSTWHNFSEENLVKIQNLDESNAILELFHGPTAAFKDFGLQLAAAFFNMSLKRQNKTAIVFGATSGDTGSAAIDACKRFDSIKSFILLPEGNMSDVQRRQMTTVDSPNVYTLLIDGTFDDCQTIVKQAFNERPFLKNDQFLLAVNSINWVRIIGQICYYFYASLKISEFKEPLNFSVPTGNFGNVFACYSAQGSDIGAWGLTEHNTGSDAKEMSTTARKEGDKWVLNGTKNFITHGISGDIAVVIARNGEKGNNRGMTAFVVERGTPGFCAGKKENKLGMRASETAEMIFEECVISDENRLGPVGDGFIQSMKILDGGRISIAALSLGIAKGAYNASLKYSKERKQFGKSISNFQGISFKLADMVTEIEAASLLTQKASEMKNQNLNVTQAGAMAKLFASETCVKVANEAVQIHGGYGFTKDFPVEKFLRDSKLCTIGEGTSEIQKVVIARKILND